MKLKKRKLIAVVLVLGILSWVVYLILFQQRIGKWYFKYSPQSIIQPSEGNAQLLCGEFSLRINYPRNSSTTIKYVLPLNDKGEVYQEAENMIFLAPAHGSADYIKKNGLPQWAKNMAARLHCAIFTLTINTAVEDIDQPGRYYIYPEVGWYELVFNIHNELCRQFNLKNLPLIAIGESSGSSMAQYMAVLNPDLTAAALWNGGRDFLPIPPDSQSAFLALNIWGDEQRILACRDLQERADADGVQLLYGECRPATLENYHKFVHHFASAQTYQVFEAFVAELLQMRRHYGQITSYRSWPVTYEFLGRELRFPSTDFLNLWLSLRPELSLQTLPMEYQNNPQNLLLKPEQAVKASRLVILLHGGNFYDPEIKVQDDITHLLADGAEIFLINPLLYKNFESDVLPVLRKTVSESNLPVIFMDLGNNGTLSNLIITKAADLKITECVVYAPSEIDYVRKVAENLPDGANVTRIRGVRRFDRSWFEVLKKASRPVQSNDKTKVTQ